VIGEHDAVRRLITICPGFQDSLAFYMETYGRLDESYNVIGELAKWVVGQIRGDEFNCFTDLFNEFESVLVNATEDARQVLVIGFLEDIHNLTVRFHKPAEQIDPDVVLRYLGPKSRTEWFLLVRQYLDWGETWPGRTDDE
jgi:hypothetical protein